MCVQHVAGHRYNECYLFDWEDSVNGLNELLYPSLIDFHVYKRVESIFGLYLLAISTKKFFQRCLVTCLSSYILCCVSAIISRVSSSIEAYRGREAILRNVGGVRTWIPKQN